MYTIELETHINKTQASVVAWATLDSTFLIDEINGTNKSPPPAPKKPFIKPAHKPTLIYLKKSINLLFDNLST